MRIAHIVTIFLLAAQMSYAQSEESGYILKDAGVKLGVKRYYDSFQRQWRTEPIVTPSVKIGKLNFEFPVGPLVRELMEKLLSKKPNNGPIIMPDFN